MEAGLEPRSSARLKRSSMRAGGQGCCLLPTSSRHSRCVTGYKQLAWRQQQLQRLRCAAAVHEAGPQAQAPLLTLQQQQQHQLLHMNDLGYAANPAITAAADPSNGPTQTHAVRTRTPSPAAVARRARRQQQLQREKDTMRAERLKREHEKQLMRDILACASASDMLALLQRCPSNAPPFAPRHISAALTQLLRLQPPEPRPRRAPSRSAWSRSGSERTASSTHTKPAMQLLDSCTSASSHLLPLWRPREASNVLWAASQLRLPLDTTTTTTLLDTILFSPNPPNSQDLANTLHACAALNHTPSKAWLQAFESASLPLLLSPLRLPPPTSLPHSPNRQQPPAPASNRQPPPPRPAMIPHELSTILHAFAVLNHAPSAPWLATFWSASAPDLRSLPPQALCGIMWAASQLHSPAPPPAAWIHAAWQAVWDQLQHMSWQQLASAIWAVSRLSRLAAPASTQLPGSSSSATPPATASSTPKPPPTSAVAAQDPEPVQQGERALLPATAGSSPLAPDTTPRRAPHAAAAAPPPASHLPSAAWMASFLSATADAVSRGARPLPLSPTSRSHPQFTPPTPPLPPQQQQQQQQQQQEDPLFPAHALSNMLCALADLGYRPPAPWLDTQLAASLLPGRLPAAPPAIAPTALPGVVPTALPSAVPSVIPGIVRSVAPGAAAPGTGANSPSEPLAPSQPGHDRQQHQQQQERQQQRQQQQQQQQRQRLVPSPVPCPDALSILHSCAKLRYSPPAPVAAALLQATYRGMPACSPPQLADLIWALGKLGLPQGLPPAWIDRYWSCSFQALHRMDTAQLSRLLPAAVALQQQQQQRQQRGQQGQWWLKAAPPPQQQLRPGPHPPASSTPDGTRAPTPAAAAEAPGAATLSGSSGSSSSGSGDGNDGQWIPEPWGARALQVLEHHLRRQELRERQAQGEAGGAAAAGGGGGGGEADAGSEGTGPQGERRRGEGQWDKSLVRALSPHQLLATVWALGHSRSLNPPLPLRSLLLAAGAGAERLRGLSPRQLAQLPLLLVAAGCRRPHDRHGFQRQLLARTGRPACLNKMLGLELCRLVSGVAALGCYPPARWLKQVLRRAEAPGVMTGLPTHYLSSLLFALNFFNAQHLKMPAAAAAPPTPPASLLAPHPRLRSQLHAACLAALTAPDCTAETPFRLLYPLYRMGCSPRGTAWWAAVYSSTQPLTPSMSGKQLANLLYLLAMFGVEAEGPSAATTPPSAPASKRSPPLAEAELPPLVMPSLLPDTASSGSHGAGPGGAQGGSSSSSSSSGGGGGVQGEELGSFLPPPWEWVEAAFQQITADFQSLDARDIARLLCALARLPPMSLPGHPSWFQRLNLLIETSSAVYKDADHKLIALAWMYLSNWKVAKAVRKRRLKAGRGSKASQSW